MPALPQVLKHRIHLTDAGAGQAGIDGKGEVIDQPLGDAPTENRLEDLTQ